MEYLIIGLSILLGVFLFSFVYYFREYKQVKDEFKQVKDEYEIFNQINIGDYVSCEMNLINNNGGGSKDKFTLYYSGKVTHINVENKSIKIKYDDFYTKDIKHMQFKSDFPYFMEQWINKSNYKKIYKNDPRSEKLKGILKSI